MALVTKHFYTGSLWMFEVTDPRTDELGLFLMSSPIFPILITVAYLYFCLYLGPKIMKNRQPFDLKRIIILYNISQVILNLKITYESIVEAVYYSNWNCYPIDYGYSPRSLHIVRMYHLYFLIKVWDLLDTIFFVLRKKNENLNFLHLYHHGGMVILIWVTVKFFSGGHGVWVGLLNGSVHVIMYTYYLLTALDGSWKKNVTFKKFITQIQMVQFAGFVYIYGRLLFTDCAYPKICCYLFVPQNVFMFLLFLDFYRRAYFNKTK